MYDLYARFNQFAREQRWRALWSETVTVLRLYIHLVRMFETVVAISAHVDAV